MNRDECELLAPAGSLETFYAVINAGADAVYLGGTKFGARAYANNFTQEEMLLALDYAHLRGKKVFLTVNTLLKENELEQGLLPYLTPFYVNGLDAVIVQDLGVFSFIHSYFPKLAIHISTQMSICNTEGARLMHELGASRIVTARELSLGEIRKIHEEVPIEIESFIHGALCYCYSGQCLMSSMLGGRSGNRGRCAQPCRLPYETLDSSGSIRMKKSNILSPKDMCTIELLPQLLESGIFSLKIEGRMKQTNYAAGVVAMYRNYLDLYLEHGAEQYHVNPEDYRTLLNYGNRSGFTEGYYFRQNGKDMITFDSAGHNRITETNQQEVSTQPLKISIQGEVTLKIGQPAYFRLWNETMEVSVTGELVQAASKRPITLEEVQSRMEKTGTTNYEFKQLSIHCDSDIFLPVSKLNELRREGLELFQKKCLQQFQKDYKEPEVQKITPEIQYIESPFEQITVSMETLASLEDCLKRTFVTQIYFDSVCFQKESFLAQLSAALLKVSKHGKKAYLILPAVFRMDTAAFFEKIWNELEALPIFGFVARNYDALGFLRKKEQESNYKFQIITDLNLYAYSQRAAAQLQALGACKVSIPIELNKLELGHLSGSNRELMIYGYLPLMISAQCVHKNTGSCDQTQETLFLKDRFQYEFPVKNYCDYCYSILYNSQPMSLLHLAKEIEELNIRNYRIHFTMESQTEARAVLDCYEAGYLRKETPLKDAGILNHTNGHFKRGVE
ncbi:MAG: U32 family peptidase [Lachnospiraceae bacterium]